MYTITKAWVMLQGKKCYIVGGLWVLLGCFNSWDTAQILTGLSIIAGKSALTTASQ